MNCFCYSEFMLLTLVIKTIIRVNGKFIFIISRSIADRKNIFILIARKFGMGIKVWVL